jgi:hypothetical protein
MPVVSALVIYHIVTIEATFDASVDLSDGVKFYFRAVHGSEVSSDTSDKAFVSFTTPASVTTSLS